MQILVVMAGKGQRFKDAGYHTPKPFIDINGKTMVRRTVESLPFITRMNPENLAFAVLKEHRDMWAVDTILKEEFGDTITIIEIPKVTRGNLETAYIAAVELLKMNEDNPFYEMTPLCILDSDNVYQETGLNHLINRIKIEHGDSPWAIICDFEPIDDKTHWCFAEKMYKRAGLDEFVGAVHEKHPDGPKIGNPMVGTFIFSSIWMFKETAKEVLGKETIPPNGEYYMSQAISRILEVEWPVYRFEVTNVQPLGTPEYLEKFISPHDRKLRICFDLDDTILHGKRSDEQYGSEDPQRYAADFIRLFHSEGHYIIIYTARHMRTCDGNVGKVLARQGMATLKWLEDNDIPYDEIHFGKPHADIFVDDKAFRHDGDWLTTKTFIRRFQRGEINGTL